MRAVVYSGYGITPALTEVADPVCPADGVVIAVGATGVCRSDWHAWQGHEPVALPHIGGHEFAGVVSSQEKTTRSLCRRSEQDTMTGRNLFVSACVVARAPQLLECLYLPAPKIALAGGPMKSRAIRGLNSG